jgi:hypothetical protein
VTEQAAKLTVKVKLHAAQPVVLPTQAAPARFSKLKLTVGALVLLLLLGFGYLLWLNFVAKVPVAVAANHRPLQQTQPIQQAMPTSTAAVTSLTSPEETVVDPKDAEPIATSVKTTTASDIDVLLPASVASAIPALAAPVKQPQRLPEGFSRIVLTATMEKLEPGEAIDSMVAEKQIQRLYLFTELEGYAGQELIHRWSFAGKVQADVLLTIEDSPWRTYSEKWLLPNQLGSWRVEIIDQQQNVLYQHDFQYQ